MAAQEKEVARMVLFDFLKILQGKCDCSSGVFDLDCSIESTLIPIDSSNSKIIPGLSWAYFYFPIQSILLYFSDFSDFQQEVDVVVQKGLGQADLYMLVNPESVYDLPNIHYNNWTYSILENRMTDSFSTKKAIMNSVVGSNFVIAAFNPEFYSIKFEASLVLKGNQDKFDLNLESGDDWRTLLSYFLIALCGLFILLGPVISFCRTRSSRDFGRDRVVPGQRSSAQAQKVNLKSQIKFKPNKPKVFKIGKYFPKKKYEDCLSNFEQLT